MQAKGVLGFQSLTRGWVGRSAKGRKKKNETLYKIALKWTQEVSLSMYEALSCSQTSVIFKHYIIFVKSYLCNLKFSQCYLDITKPLPNMKNSNGSWTDRKYLLNTTNKFLAASGCLETCTLCLYTVARLRYNAEPTRKVIFKVTVSPTLCFVGNSSMKLDLQGIWDKLRSC